MSQLPPSKSRSGATLVGRIDIPRVHISVMLAEGTSPQVVRVAVGRILGTALPGQAGNVALAAHRDALKDFHIWRRRQRSRAEKQLAPQADPTRSHYFNSHSENYFGMPIASVRYVRNTDMVRMEVRS
jgi:superfamily II DNA or RNA helicase